MASPDRSTQTGVGPLTANPTIVNDSALGTTPVKILSGSSTIHGRVRRCRLLIVTAARNVAWTTVDRGATAPSITALGAGAATEGVLILPEERVFNFNVLDNKDVYVVASAASTVVQLAYTEE
jgi:hypothetical protein